MNHLLLPDSRLDAGPVDTVGAIAMERLINALMRLSADRRRLRAKLFGGSSMLSGMTDVGLRNTEFAITYLQRESIPCDAHSTGGPRARQIRFQPSTGKVKLRFVAEVPEIRPVIAPRQNGVELF